MNLKEIFTLITNLNRKERSNFSKYVRISNRRKPDYYSLYEALTTTNSFDEKGIKDSLGFRSPSKYYKAKMMLPEKII